MQPDRPIFLFPSDRDFKCRNGDGDEGAPYETSTVDKTIWNPRPEIDLASRARAVSDESNSFRFILGHQNENNLFSPGPGVAGLGLFDQKNAIAATTPIATAFKFCVRHSKMGS
jgi:hypothetical protein